MKNLVDQKNLKVIPSNLNNRKDPYVKHLYLKENLENITDGKSVSQRDFKRVLRGRPEQQLRTRNQNLKLRLEHNLKQCQRKVCREELYTRYQGGMFTSRRYHDRIVYNSIEEAVADGMRPCGNGSPERL